MLFELDVRLPSTTKPGLFMPWPFNGAGPGLELEREGTSGREDEEA